MQPPLEHPIAYEYRHDDEPDRPRRGWKMLTWGMYAAFVLLVLFLLLR
jgi:hypothetical protein